MSSSGCTRELPRWLRVFVLVVVLLASSGGAPARRSRRSRRGSPSKGGGGGGGGGHSRPKGGWPMPMTPGQPSPGDPSYLSDTCRHHVDDDRTEYHGHPDRKGDPKALTAWNNKHPDPIDLELIETVIKQDGGSWCPYLTRECVKPDVVYKFHRGNKKKGTSTVITRFFTQEQWEELPSIPKGFFGSCAFVSLADTVITEKGWGPIIDSHDTVMRLGHPPLKGFEKDLGTRADVVLGRGAALGAKLPEGYHPKWTLGCQFQGSNATAAEGWGTIRDDKRTDSNAGPKLMRELYQRMVDPLHKPRGATTGIYQALGVVFSGLCTRLDIFGMSPYNGGHYFCNKGNTHTFTSFYTTSSCGKLKYTHSPGIENWLLHYIMKNFPELNTCVYL